MPGPYQVLLDFDDNSGYGWTEKYYTGISPSVASAITLAQALVPARLQVLPVGSELVRFRLSTGVKRYTIALFTADVIGNPQGTYPQAQGPTEVALELIMGGATPGVNRVFMRTLCPTDYNGDSFNPSSAFLSRLNAYAAFLINNGSFVIKTSVGTTAMSYAISGVIGTPPRGMLFTTVAAPPAQGTYIRIKGCTVPGYNGLKLVTGVAAGTPNVVTCGGVAPPVAQPAVASTFTPVTYTNFGLATVQAGKLTRRAAGRPFGQLRGRQPTLYALR